MFLFYGSAKLFEKNIKYQREKEEVLINNIIQLNNEVNYLHNNQSDLESNLESNIEEINNRIDDLEESRSHLADTYIQYAENCKELLKDLDVCHKEYLDYMKIHFWK